MTIDHRRHAAAFGLASAENNKMYDTWSQHMYTVVVITLAASLILMYVVTLCKVCHGTSFSFIVTLIVLLIVSNIGYIGATSFDHKAAYLGNQHQINPD